MLRAPRNVFRLLRIARVLARHGALFPLEELGLPPALLSLARLLGRPRPAEGRPGERLAAALQELGPSFIKAGQSLATRADLLGEEVAADLSALQDRLPPFSAAEARATIEAELGQPVAELFASFEDKPVAAASIAQVHFATVANGDGGPPREVAVKVLRPGIEAAFGRDLDLFYWLAGLVERGLPEFRRLRPVAVIDAFAETVAIEMDLRLEAAAAAELAENMADDPAFRVPEVDWERTARRVLTTARIAGIPLDEREALVAAGHDLDAVMAQAATSFFAQVFRDGFFHADQHPGNIFVAADGAFEVVDFGIMGRLDRKTRYYLADMLLGFLNRDYARVAEVHFEAGYVPAGKSRAAFTQALRAIGEPILGKPLAEISLARLLGQLFQTTKTFEMETQPQLLLLQKTMAVAEGVGRTLNPKLNMWELARPLIEDWMRQNRGPEARVREAAEEAGEVLRRLPKILADAGEAAEMLAGGGLKLHPDTVRALARGERGTNPLVWPLWAVAAALVLVALLLIF